MINGQWVEVADLIPPGMISAFGGAVAPTGYLLCDGSAVSRTTYAALFSVIGTNYGAGDGSSTFNLPDLRGQFLRGVDGSAGVDPDKASRTALKSGGNSGNNVGSAQACATKKPTTPLTGSTGNDSPDHAHSISVSSGYGEWSFLGGGSWGAGGSSGGATARHTHTVTISAGGDAETRPTNVYVNYIIKT
jgi:microcystin-dependent protein